MWTRACFDFCAADIRDTFFPNLPERTNVYFPFHSNELTQNGKPLQPLTIAHPSLHSTLLDMVNRMQNVGEVIPQTLSCHYSDIKAMKDLVDKQKHTNIEEIGEQEKAATRLQFPTGLDVVVALQISDNDGNPQSVEADEKVWQGSPGVQISVVKDFVFTHLTDASQNDVRGFSTAVIAGTRILLGEVYAAGYGLRNNIFLE